MDRRQSECRSVGDPHIITFDGRSVFNFLTHIILLGDVLTTTIVIFSIQLMTKCHYKLIQSKLIANSVNIMMLTANDACA